MEDARADIGMSGTDDEMSDEDFSFDSGDDRPPSWTFVFSENKSNFEIVFYDLNRLFFPRKSTDLGNFAITFVNKSLQITAATT